MLYARRTLLLTGGEHGFSTLRHCRRGQGFRMLEITVPYFLHSTVNYQVSHINSSHRKEKRKNRCTGIQVIVFPYRMKTKPRKQSKRLEDGSLDNDWVD